MGTNAMEPKQRKEQSRSNQCSLDDEKLAAWVMKFCKQDYFSRDDFSRKKGSFSRNRQEHFTPGNQQLTAALLVVQMFP
jgi:hypothetical protein